MTLLDTVTVTVAHVAPAEAEGHIADTRYWNPLTQQFETSFPQNLPSGSTIGVVAYCQNDMASGNLAIYCDFTFIKGGVEIQKYTGSYDGTPTAPGAQKPIICEHPNATEGYWAVKVEMYGEVIS